MLAHRGGAGSSQDDDGLMTVQKSDGEVVGVDAVRDPFFVAVDQEQDAHGG